GGSVTGGGSSGGTVTGGGSSGGSVTGGGSSGGTVTGGGSGGGSVTGGGSGGGSVTGGGAGGGGMGGGSAGGAPRLPGETCADAMASMSITAPVTLSAQNLGNYTDDYQWFGQPNCTPNGTVGPDRVYSLTIPANQRVRVTATPGPSWDMSVQLTDLCVAGSNSSGQTCIAGVNNQGAGQPEVLGFLNASPSARTVLLVIDTFDQPPAVTNFDLVIEFLPQVLGDVCSNATPLPVSATAQDLSTFSNDYANGAGCATLPGNDRVYSATIPTGNRLSATVTSTFADGGVGFAPGISIIAAASCVAGSGCVASSSGASSATTFFDNVGPTPLPVFVVIDTSTAVVQGPFSITSTIAPSALLPGDVCNNTASVITTSTMLTAQPFAGFTGHYGLVNEGPNCFFEDGPDRVYEVAVPAGFRLRAIANATFPYAVSIVPGPASNCLASEVTCLAGQAQSFVGGLSTTVFENAGAMTRTVFVIVDRTAATPMPDTFTLGIDLQLIPPNDTCASSGTPITTGTTLMAQNLGASGNDYQWGGLRCASSSGSPDLVYPVTVAPGTRLTATVTSAGFNPILNVVDGSAGCTTSMTCLAGSNVLATNVETITWDNVGTTPRTVFVGVESASATPTTFDIAFALSASPPPPYVKTSIAAACQTLTAAASPVAAIGDDVESTWAALPFTLSYFGAPVTAFSVSSNGYVGFSSLTSGAIERQFSNTVIPDSDVPNGIVAPFWDDLINVTAPATQVRAETFGVAGSRRWVVEWASVTFYPPSSPERLTFQVQVVEGTNVIEFHYCSLAANGATSTDRTSGGSASFGLENATGTVGVEHSVNLPNAVTTGSGLRFTP
ncbi:MAG: hypothetical protein INH37_04780, partial [Myxococcaceae bacterium]|nr:hypothetical protein [Myxococcaceae bacterium]